jgi:hypothetical protein
LIRRLRIGSTHVWVYLTYSPENDDETPPVSACLGVRSYGRQVKRVTVYGSPTAQGKAAILDEC